MFITTGLGERTSSALVMEFIHRQKDTTGHHIFRTRSAHEVSVCENNSKQHKFFSIPNFTRGVSLSRFSSMAGQDSFSVSVSDSQRSVSTCRTEIAPEILLQLISDSQDIEKVLKTSQGKMSATEFDQFLRGLARDIEQIDIRQSPSTSIRKKLAYAAILSLCFAGASASVAGVIPLGADATPHERTVGIIQFVLSALFCHGAIYSEAMANVLSSIDEQMSEYSTDSEGFAWSKFFSDVRQGIRQTRCRDVVPTVLALGIAAYSPMLDALNSRVGGINMVTLGSADPALMATGQRVGSTLMALNWAAGFCLPAIMAKSLFAGYINDAKELRYGARDQKKMVNQLVDILDKALLISHFKQAAQYKVAGELRLTREECQQVISKKCSRSDIVTRQAVKSALRGDTPDARNLRKLLSEIGVEADAQLAELLHVIDQQAFRTDPHSRELLQKGLERLLLSPLLAMKVQQRLAGKPVEYRDAYVRMNAAGKLGFRLLVNWLALNGIAVTFAAPMVVGHYKGYLENPALDVDCHYLRNISDTIEPFDNLLFQFGLASYMAQGLALSDAAIRSFQYLLIPLSFIASGCNFENMNRAWQSVIKSFDGAGILGLLAGGLGASAFISVIVGAGGKYREYLDLLDCGIGVPDAPVVVEFKGAEVIAQYLLMPIMFYITISAWQRIFKNVSAKVKPCELLRFSNRQSHHASVIATDDLEPGTVDGVSV